MDDLQHFVHMLASVPAQSNVLNQYAYDVDANDVRRANLLLYLQQMKALDPSVLLVGEAAGYKGTRQSGIPLVSEHIMLEGIPGVRLLGRHHGYRKTDEFPGHIWRSQTTTALWGVLREVRHVPLLWDAFPFHPYRQENQSKNRTPTTAELMSAQPFLRELLATFNVRVVVAMGNKAKESLSQMGIESEKVRHPAQGGKAQFRREFLAILADLD